MAELLMNGKLQGDTVLHYLGYTAKIGELATKYTWQSVLLYDKEYREAQAALGFSWGANSPYIHGLCLRPRAEVKTAGQAGHFGHNSTASAPSARKQGPFTANGIEICRLYNLGQCQNGTRCRRAHVCRIPSCEQSHPAFEHPKNGPTPNPYR